MIVSAKKMAKQLLPPVVTTLLRKARGVGLFPTTIPNGVSIVEDAKKHFQQAALLSSPDLPQPSRRWSKFLEKIRVQIGKVRLPQQAISYVQGSTVAFEHRNPSEGNINLLLLHDATIKSEFPQFSSKLNRTNESPYSRRDSLALVDGRLVSNMYYLHLWYLLRNLTYIPAPETVCEIGGGYGSLARLWFANPWHRPQNYIIVDFPEVLFFAEIFLKVNLTDVNILYISDKNSLSLERNGRGVILCPIAFAPTLKEKPIDLVINTGSLQEMPEEWVDYWMCWLDTQACKFFYSVNYLAQPLDFMAEGANSWSPRLSRMWVARFQRVDFPLVKQQGTRHWAEIFAEKLPAGKVSTDRLAARYQLTKERFLDNQTLLEAFDVVRLSSNEEIYWDLLRRCVSEMPFVPKEAYYLAQALTDSGNADFKERYGDELRVLFEQLKAVRARGQEDDFNLQ